MPLFCVRATFRSLLLRGRSLARCATALLLSQPLLARGKPDRALVCAEASIGGEAAPLDSARTRDKLDKASSLLDAHLERERNFQHQQAEAQRKIRR